LEFEDCFPNRFPPLLTITALNIHRLQVTFAFSVLPTHPNNNMIRHIFQISSVALFLSALLLWTNMDATQGLSQRTQRRLRIPLPSLSSPSSIRPNKVIRLRYTSSRSTENSNDVFSLEDVQQAPTGKPNVATTSTVTTTVTKHHVIMPSGEKRIDTTPIFLANASAAAVAAIPTTEMSSNDSEGLSIVSRTWKRIRAASHVDKEAIAKLGISFGLTYNLISNINGSISLSLAWYIASVKVRAKE
jgi:hypothetical protein